jgi:Na+/H+ antiporter
MEAALTSQVLVTVIFLLTAALASLVLKKINFPYTIGLVIIGVLLGYVSNEFTTLSILQHLNLSPSLILYIILPTLVFDAAINIDGRMLMRNIVPILLLAVFGLLISTGIIGWLLTAATSISLTGAMLFGALISATDPVAVIALFKEIGAPKRLVTLIDGESLFNDATAIVLFTIVLSTIGSGVGSAGQNFSHAMAEFFTVLVGGLLVGVVVGFTGAYTLKLARRDLIYQTSVSFVMAYVSFIIADSFHVSGVMSTLAAGLVLRNRSEEVISRSTIENIEHFWDYFSFVANSFVFLLLGITEAHIFKSGLAIKESLVIVAIAVPVIVVARAAAIFILVPAYNSLPGQKKKNIIPLSFQAVLLWGGLRGAVPVALVLAIPKSFAEREIVIHLTFAFILFTLLVQGTTIKKLMNFFGIQPDKDDFSDKKTVSHVYPFPGQNLASLVMSRVVKVFDDEGFFVRKRQEGEDMEYLLKRRVHIVAMKLEGSGIRITTLPDNLSYVKTILYEALLELYNSVASIKEVVKPEQLQHLVQSDASEPIKFKIMKYIRKENIRTGLAAESKEELLGEMVRILVDSGDVENYDEALAGVLERESTMTTGLGEGVALPHARTDVVDTIKVAIGIKRKGIDFDALDGNPVQIIFLVLSPKNASGPHLEFLSSVSKILSSPETRSRLLGAKSSDAFYDIIRNSLE